MSKVRLDVALVNGGHFHSREKAQRSIMAGQVYVNGQKAGKSSLPVSPEDTLEVRGSAHPYASRGGLKLEKALAAFDADVRGVVAMDIGAASGGFTDVLLQNGAAHVYAIDVGYGQLDWRLRTDARVTVMERTNARYLTAEQLPLNPTLCVMDVSFISIRLLLPTLAALMGEKGRFLTLIKPQFEAGRERVGKKGVVREQRTHIDVILAVCACARDMGWCVQDLTFSPITGPEGNIEFLADIVPLTVARQGVDQARIIEVVQQAHESLVRKI